MSNGNTHSASHGATTVKASKGGGAGKLLLAGVAALVLLGGGYYAWTKYAPPQNANTDLAYNDPYTVDPLRAGPVAPGDEALSADAATSESTNAPASAPRTATARRTTPRSTAAAEPVVPEETIGVTPVNAETAAEDNGEIVVNAPPRPIWSRTPTARRLTALYPERALSAGREGEARLHCTVQENGALDCMRVQETRGGGFGNAALRVARAYRHSTTLADGSSAVGTPVNLRVVFRLEDDGRRG